MTGESEAFDDRALVDDVSDPHGLGDALLRHAVTGDAVNGAMAPQQNGTAAPAETANGDVGVQSAAVAVAEAKTAGQKSDQSDGNRDAKGRYLPGHTIGGPGRPKGSVAFFTVVKQKAKEAGLPLDDLVWAATRGLALRASRGDAAAAKTLLDRLCGPVEKAPSVNVDARSVVTGAVPAGPPLPEGDEFGDWVRNLNKVAAQQGLLSEGDTPERLVEHAAAEVQEVEDLLE